MAKAKKIAIFQNNKWLNIVITHINLATAAFFCRDKSRPLAYLIFCLVFQWHNKRNYTKRDGAFLTQLHTYIQDITVENFYFFCLTVCLIAHAHPHLSKCRTRAVAESKKKKIIKEGSFLVVVSFSILPPSGKINPHHFVPSCQPCRLLYQTVLPLQVRGSIKPAPLPLCRFFSSRRNTTVTFFLPLLPVEYKNFAFFRLTNTRA